MILATLPLVCVVIRLNGLVADFAKTKSLGGCNLVLFAADKTFYQL